MHAEIGHIALIIAFMIAITQSVIPLIGARQRDARLMLFGDRAAIAQLLLTALSFIALTFVFLQSDFSVKLAALHSHTAKPLPFERLVPMPVDGQGMNPVLQDPGLAFHPPFLYLGYVGFSVAFSFAIAALIEGRVDAVWARWLRPWVLTAWSFLTIGIALGSYWAYYELGWGGWWMWDPVENVSFMPWLAGTALLHSILVLGTRHTMANWTVLLAITTFSLSLVGAFVVRSGILVSVHSFAVDPERGVFILALLSVATGGALALYAVRNHTLRQLGDIKPISRDGTLVLNNLFLCVATATVFLGTFYPLFIDALTGEKISVGAPYFDLTFGPIMMVLLVFMGIGPLLKWRTDSLSKLKRFGLISVAIIIAITALTAIFGKSILGGLSLGLCAYLAIATLNVLAKRARLGQVSFSESITLLRAQPAATYAFIGAHLGVAIFAAGVTCITVWSEDSAKALRPGETMQVAGYEFTLRDMGSGFRENYEFVGGNVDISKNGEFIDSVYSERRYFEVRNMLTTEAGLRLSLGNTLFASIGEGDGTQGWIVRAYVHPYVVWIWLGSLIMALSGFIALADRRLRIARDVPDVEAISSTSALPAE